MVFIGPDHKACYFCKRNATWRGDVFHEANHDFHGWHPIFFEESSSYLSMEPRKKKTLAFHYSGCLIRILIIVYYTDTGIFNCVV